MPGAARCVRKNASGEYFVGFAVKDAQVKIWLKMLDKQNVNSILSEMKGSFNVVLKCFWMIRFMSKRSISLVSVSDR